MVDVVDAMAPTLARGDSAGMAMVKTVGYEGEAKGRGMRLLGPLVALVVVAVFMIG
jgi:hypothetical protein